MNTLKLICETATYDLDIIEEQANENVGKKLKICGPMIIAGKRNGNGRLYLPEIMEKSVSTFDKELISTSRAVGELNHPTSIDVNYNNACHLITNLKQDGNIWLGESNVLLGTTKGDLLAGLLSNGVRVGMSTRGVGNINEQKEVDEYKLITIDVVHEPSGPGCFMEGILESKNFMINEHGDIVEIAYEKLTQELANLPRHTDARSQQIAEAIRNFLIQI